MGKNKSYERTTSGPVFYAALAVVLYFLFSVAVAVATINDCDGFPDRSWTIWPPGWECEGRGF
ncbi:MAG TPA: hypothetical protein VK866_08575 [Acidimicrobiales bacterium]|nr:hypothetical protein [Acidimicrobiales bacterium]